MSEPPEFDDVFRRGLQALLLWRRDVRRFRRDALPDGSVERLLASARLAPSVGLSEPWRFVLVESREKRGLVQENFSRSNREALAGYDGDRARLYAELKLQGIDTAPLQIAVFADGSTSQGHGLGRATMPETTAYSVVTAVHTIWLTARAEGLGCGWVSILDPDRVRRDLDVPAAWRLIAYLCLGYPESESEIPELERAGWEARRDVSEFTLTR